MRLSMIVLVLPAFVVWDSATAQQNQKCEILKQAIGGNPAVQGQAQLSGAKVPPNLRWPDAGTYTLVGKGRYSVSLFEGTPGDWPNIQQLVAMAENLVAQCFPAARRIPDQDGTFFCAGQGGRAIHVWKSGGSRLASAGLDIEVPYQKVCR